MRQKIAFVTGATRGIGAEIAKFFCNSGSKVFGTRSSKGSIENQYCSDWITSDFKNIKEIYHCHDMVKKIKPDVLINCAGINKIDPFVDIDPDEFLLIQQINLFAPFLLCQAAIPSMKSNKWGRIVNISSIWGKIGKEFRASYMASKFGLDGMTAAIAAEYASEGILANCVAPGFTDTELTRKTLGLKGMQNLSKSIPIKKIAKPSEIAEFVFWLASDKNTYISGQNIPVDGGFTRV